MSWRSHWRGPHLRQRTRGAGSRSRLLCVADGLTGRRPIQDRRTTSPSQESRPLQLRTETLDQAPRPSSHLNLVVWVFLPEAGPSTGACAAVSPYLSDLGLKLVEEVFGCTGDNPVANQEQRRA